MIKALRLGAYRRKRREFEQKVTKEAKTDYELGFHPVIIRDRLGERDIRCLRFFELARFHRRPKPQLRRKL